MSWTDFIKDGLGAYVEIEKSKNETEKSKWDYMSNVPQNTGDPNDFREAEPVKGQQSNGETLVALPNQKYGGVPVWGWGVIGLTFVIILSVLVMSLSRGK
ncbi:hypothetical protein B9J90_13440 [Vibrio sp. V09_P4A23P171]|uniref:hypothetical protein n=1 Tax=unclassified Vibrio TaxID=2614977 RepID=UPI000B8E389D|nr:MULTISPECIES: hypothetical protein [unclassified Vibrio]NCO45018.1 hypothetical protein [Vibrio sp.]NNN98130.1 hypothetical protein [Vibrio sp. B1-2]OXX34143.1 hypothetical protein B9J90_13440 [Vibrio sp. V09_P4A23P171]